MSSKRRPSFFRSLFSMFAVRRSSLSPPQSPRSSPPPPPPPPLRWIPRPDTALPPTYDQTWDTVRNNDMWPLFLRENESNFEAHAADNILNEPNWFLHLESRKYSATKFLWRNVVRLKRDSDYHKKHWSVQFLRYALVQADHQSTLPSVFASLIVFEVIFTVLTPYPEQWPAGIDAIAGLTQCTHASIMRWFVRRRDFESRSPESLELDENTSTFTYRSTTEGHSRDHRIRKDAFDYLEHRNKVEQLLYEEGSFSSVLIYDLRPMARRRRKCRNFFPPASFYGS